MKRNNRGVVGRDSELATTISFLDHGASVHVIGARGSGRSAFLRLVTDRLKALGSSVVTIQGNAALRQHPLAAVHLTGVLPNGDGRLPASMTAAADGLAKALRAPSSVLIIDDWDELDETSWGVIDTVRRSTGTPMVVSRRRGRAPQHAPHTATAPTADHSYVIDMSPLTYEALESVVRTHLGGDVDTHTMSRIFAKSGGVVGIALHIVDAATRDGALAERGGVWQAEGSLWSRSLRGVVEAHLDDLDGAARDALEMISLLGILDVQSACKLVDWTALETLEAQGFLRVVRSGSRQLLTVVPPLVVEYFRHEPVAVRRLRLTAQISERLADDDNATEMLSATAAPAVGPDGDAVFVRLIQERVRARTLTTRAAWEAHPVAETAIDYLEALVRADAPVETLRDVLHRTDASAGTPHTRARFAIAFANATAFVDRDVEAALRGLRQIAPDLGVHGLVVEAAEVTLTAHTGEIPEDFAARLAVRDEYPLEVKLALWEAQMIVLVSLGRFGDARRVYRDVEAAADGQQSPAVSALVALALLGEGDPDAALAWSMRGVDEARELLDIDAARAHGAMAALCLMMAGDYQPVEQLLETLTAAGNPLPFPSGISMMLTNMGAVIASRRGDAPAAERLTALVSGMRERPGPLPGQASVWAEAQLLAFQGEHRRAADLIWEQSEQLWSRGARFSSALGALASAEIHDDKNRRAVAVDRAAQVGGGLLLSHAQFLEARAAEDPDALVSAFDSLRAAGRKGLAITALRLASELYVSRGDARRAAAMEARVEAFAESLAPRWLDTVRYVSTAVPLTDRELEVARLVAQGLSNPEVADNLVLSVRTVESHMNRIMRKLKVSSRQAVKWYIESRVIA